MQAWTIPPGRVSHRVGISGPLPVFTVLLEHSHAHLLSHMTTELSHGDRDSLAHEAEWALQEKGFYCLAAGSRTSLMKVMWGGS